MVDIAEKQGFFKEAGLEIEVLYTEGGASTLTPVLAGSIDIAMSNGILGVIGAYSKGAPVRVIAAEGTGAADAFWYARTESGIKSLKDTNGKTVAFSSPGSSTNLILLQLVKAAGVTSQAGADWRRACDLHPSDDRTDRRRLVSAAFRTEGLAGEEDRHHRARQRCRRDQRRRPFASMSPTPTR